MRKKNNADVDGDGKIDENELRLEQIQGERSHAGRKFVFSVGVAVSIIGIIIYLLYKDNVSGALDCIPFVLACLGIYCGANVAQDFSKDFTRHR